MLPRLLMTRSAGLLAAVLLPGLALAEPVSPVPDSRERGGSVLPLQAFSPQPADSLTDPPFPCREAEGGHALHGQPSPVVKCLELHGSAAAPEAKGRVRLLPAPTPFGSAVDRNGTHIYRFEVETEGLPDPTELGPYDRYVAWITPPSLDPVVPLGTLAGSRTLLDTGGFNLFLFHVSAEGPGPHRERQGPLVLRGSSPSMVLRPHDLPYILAEMTPAPDAETLPAVDEHGHEAMERPRAHEHGRAVAGDPPEGSVAHWRPPAMHPQVDMPHQIMRLRPRISPLLPFPEDVEAVPTALPPSELHLAPGDTLVLEAGPVLRRVGDMTLPGYGFNGQSPGPRIHVGEGSTIHVDVRNRTPMPTAIHWHGLRLDWRFDGVPGVTQDPIPSGEGFLYELRMPDEGTFWYHPHLREDIFQDLGLAGNIRVHPRDGQVYPSVDHEEYLVLDDVLLGPEGPVPYGREATSHALMGRFGNVLLVNGRSRWQMDARPGETVRLHLTNVSATRTYNLSLGDLPLKVVGSDLGALPTSVVVSNVVVAPAERWVVDVHLPEVGPVALENRVQALDHMAGRFFAQIWQMGTIQVSGDPMPGAKDRAREFHRTESRPWLQEEVDRLLQEHGSRAPDRSLVLDLRVGDLPFPLDPLLSWEAAYRNPVEWEGTMPDMDWLISSRSVEWILRDPETGLENMELDWRFQVGDRVKVRLVNNRNSLHPMQHPIHLHGQRFLVLAVDGVPVDHSAWKDTVLVPVGSTVDLLLELDNPGPWMLHCHISEHLESGMMTVIQVDP